MDDLAKQNADIQKLDKNSLKAEQTEQSSTKPYAVLNPDEFPCSLDRMEYIGPIGEGGMGVVHKYRNFDDTFVAVKMMTSHHYAPETLKRFEQEGRAASRLRHPNIVALVEVGVTAEGLPYMIMDFCLGQTLSSAIKSGYQLSFEQSVNIFIQAADALAHAHENGVLHRDIKPSNIMLDEPKSIKPKVTLLDFGIAKLMDEEHPIDLTNPGEVLGSPPYMSPEQSLGKRVDTRSDIYSLGCVMYESLTLAPPFVSDSAMETIYKHQSEQPLPLSEASLGQSFDRHLESLIMKMLEKDPAARPQSMREIKQKLAAIIDPQLRHTSDMEEASRLGELEKKPAGIRGWLSKHFGI